MGKKRQAWSNHENECKWRQRQPWEVQEHGEGCSLKRSVQRAKRPNLYLNRMNNWNKHTNLLCHFHEHQISKYKAWSHLNMFSFV